MAERRFRTLLDVPESQRRAMTRDETGTFVTLVMAERSADFRPREPLELFEFVEAQFPAQAVQILARRLRAFADPDQKFSPATVVFLALLCDRQAAVVQWAFYLVHRTREVGVVDTMWLSLDFPMGFPVDEAYSELWDEQRRREEDPAGTADNAIDSLWPWRAEPKEPANV